MNLTRKIVVLFFALQTFSCSHELSKKNLTFLDSLNRDTSLTEQQLKKHTILPADYYPNNSHFVGDSVYNSHSKYPVAIITSKYHGNCQNSYLLVFDRMTLKNTDFKKIKTTCDTDYSKSHMELEFAMINDTVFCTIGTCYSADNSKPDIYAVAPKHYYKIDKNGKIDSLARFQQ